MSLDTVLQIGKVLRHAENSLQHFKYISSCPKDRDGNYPFCLSIPVNDDFTFNWNGIKITSENRRGNLYYLRFKTSDNDGLMKYVFGDIYYSKVVSLKKDGAVEKSENGGYRLADPYHSNAAYRPSSFNRSSKDFSDIVKDVSNINKSVLRKFRDSLKKDLAIVESIMANVSAVEYFISNATEIEFRRFIEDKEIIREFTAKQLLQKVSKQNLKKLRIEKQYEELSDEDVNKLVSFDSGEVFIHFDFSDREHWYNYTEDLELINKKILSDFVDETSQGLVLKKTLYKTLCSGDTKNDIQFPGFKLNAKYKSQAFDDQSIQDLFYAIDFAKKGTLIPYTDIKIIVLPKGVNLKAEDYLSFQNKGDEERANQDNEQRRDESNEPLFDIFDDDQHNQITSFDVIFTKKGGATSPDVDMSEISGIEKSNIKRTKERIKNIAGGIYQHRKEYFLNTNKEFFGFTISKSFQNVLGNPQFDVKTGKVSFKANSKYQSHLLKVLPLIYSENYFFDDALLNSFIQNVEFSIRSGDSRYNFLKFDLEFLISIQNNKNNKYMDIINSKSYLIGNLLGNLAKNFAGENSPIKSFEKNYVGNLSRRISTLKDFIKLKNEIEQKLIMHDKTKYTFQVSNELAQKIKDFNSVYDKEQSVFGFLESYFKPLPKKAKASEEE